MRFDFKDYYNTPYYKNMLKTKFNEILEADTTDSEKYKSFLTLTDLIKKCPRCDTHMLRSEFKTGYCTPCAAVYHDEYAKKTVEGKIAKTRKCGLCKNIKQPSEFYKSSVYRCKECAKKKQKEYSIKYYYKAGRDKRREQTKKKRVVKVVPKELDEPIDIVLEKMVENCQSEK